MIDRDLVKKHLGRLVEVTVKQHTRHSKKGKTYTVHQYERKGDFKTAGDLGKGDVILNQMNEEPMFTVDSVFQSRDKNYLVFRGTAGEKYKNAFPHGQWSVHKDDTVYVQKGKSGVPGDAYNSSIRSILNKKQIASIRFKASHRNPQSYK